MDEFLEAMKQDAEQQWQDYRDAMMRAEGVAMAAEQMLARLRETTAQPEPDA